VNHLIQLATAEEGGGSNFLVPNWTFVFELISFGIIMYILYKYVIPPINKAMTERQEKIKAQFDEAAQLKADAEATEKENQAQLADARAEASRIREEAREQGAQIIVQHREQAQVEAERITSNAQAQLEVERAQALSQLKGEVGAIATTLAGRIVGESLEDDKRQKRSVERFIAELEDEGKPKKSGNAKSKN
jgi:F-type H+-transporting ATPase subunit b